jgi:hypothetical protein
MNSLDPECLELKTAGVIDEVTARRAMAWNAAAFSPYSKSFVSSFMQPSQPLPPA